MLGTAALAAVWFGWPWLPLLVGAAVAGMSWEWARLTGADGALAVLIAVAALGSLAAAAFGAVAVGLGVAVLGALAVAALAGARRMRTWSWAAGGTFWIAAPGVAFLWLAALPGVGRATILWLLAVVWATDTAAYAAGRAIGGPKLAPRLSPNKTWAGLAGGVVGAGIIGLAGARLAGGDPLALSLASVGLSIVAQGGDLAESLAKRHFGVKDSSMLIPGHGGLLDRLDSALTAAAAAALMTLLGGASPLAWRV